MSVLGSTSHMRRPAFNPTGRIVVRRELTLSKVYIAGESLDASSEGLDARMLGKFWEQGLIDTLPAAPTQAPTPAPSAKRK